MVHILPFRGLRYDVQQVGGLSAVSAPPYDVISPTQQQQLYEQSPYNVVRLILNQPQPDDNATNTVYTRAAGFFADWQQRGILKGEDQPAFYGYTQTWDNIERKGVIGLVRLETFESGNVLPHERTLGGPKADRLNLMKTALGNFSQIFMIYDDPACRLEKILENSADRSPQSSPLEATDGDGVVHRLTVLSQPEEVTRLQEMFSDQVLLIADGHHRYETAVIFRDLVREKLYTEKGLPQPPMGQLLSDYVMVFLTNMNDPGLKVYPTHRVLYRWPEGWTQARFESEFFNRVQRLGAPSATSWGYWGQGQPDITPVEAGASPATQEMPTVLQSLDVAQLDAVVFQGMFGESADALKASGVLGFYRDEAELKTRMTNGEFAAVFWMDTPDVSQVRQISMAGLRMPQKSTYFYPKTLSGLVFYPYHELMQGDAITALSGVVENPIPLPGPLTDAGFDATTYQPARSELNR